MRPIITGVEPGVANLMGKLQSLPLAVEELWDAWEIHGLMLVSLFLQVFLFLFADWRRKSACALPRVILWLAYLSADSVAVFVLGHLAVRVRNPLMSFWAPFVLVHLGGQDTMTAFSRQDNELWRRHLLNLVIQVAVAGYVVGMATWPDRRLKAAMILMFVSGFLKYAERTYFLRLSSPEILRFNLIRSIHIHSGIARWFGAAATTTSKGRSAAQQAVSRKKETTPDEMLKGTSIPAGSVFWEAAYEHLGGDAPLNRSQSITSADSGELPHRLQEFRSCADRHVAYEYVGALLVHCYRRLYTKSLVAELILHHLESLGLRKPTGLWFLFFVMPPVLFMHVAALIALLLFAAADKGGALDSSSGRADITVSYLLLVGATVLDVSSIARIILPRFFSCLHFNNTSSCCHEKQWSQKLGQYNFVSSVCGPLVWVVTRESMGWDVERKPISLPVKEFILDNLLDAGTRKEWNIASTHGQLAIARSKRTRLKALEESVGSGVDFPTSVLIWHIATEIVCFHSRSGDATSADPIAKNQKMEISQKLSRYIMYLVFKCGVILTANSQAVHEEVTYQIRRKYRSLQSQQADDKSKKDALLVWLLYLEDEEDSVDKDKVNRQHQDEVIKHEEQEDEIVQIEHGEQDQDEIVQIDHGEQKDEIVKIEHHQGRSANNNADDHMRKLRQSAQALKSPVLRRAHEVAQELISIKDEADRWDLMAAVWAEMLYYTAPRCGAAFHYENLINGGEFATHVFLLMYLLGPFLPPPGA